MFRRFPAYPTHLTSVAGASFDMSTIFGMLDGVPDPLPTLIDEEDLLFGGEKTLLGILALMSYGYALSAVDGNRFPYSSQYSIIQQRGHVLHVQQYSTRQHLKTPTILASLVSYFLSNSSRNA